MPQMLRCILLAIYFSTFPLLFALTFLTLEYPSEYYKYSELMAHNGWDGKLDRVERRKHFNEIL